MEKNKSHDLFFKEVMSKKENAIDFLKNYLSKSILKQIDLVTIEIAKDSFIEEARQETYSDLLYKVNFNGKQGYIYALFEHKSYPDKYTSFQLLKYKVQIWELHIKQNGRKGKLPIILPLVIYHGKKKWKFGNDLLCIQENLIGHEKEQLNFQYQLYDLSKYSDEEIKGKIFLRASLFLLKNIYKDKFESVLVRIFDLLYELEKQPTGLKFIEVALRYIVSKKDKKILEKISEVLKDKRKYREIENTMPTIAESWLQEGFLKGKQDGVQEGFLKGKQDGVQEGFLKGKRIAERKLSIVQKKEKLRTAINLLDLKLELSQIAQAVDLEERYIERFFRRLHLI